MVHVPSTTTKVAYTLVRRDSVALDDLYAHPFLPDRVKEEAQQFSKAERQQEYLLCRLLLVKLLHTLSPQTELTPLPELVRDHNQKPYFEDHRLPQFNFSHSEEFVAVAVVKAEVATKAEAGIKENLTVKTGQQQTPQIAIDIEQHRHRDNYQKVANTFFSPPEQLWLTHHHEPLTGFWQLWTLREAALKLYSKGVWQMKSLQLDPTSLTLKAPFASDFYTHYQLRQGVHLSLCSNHPLTQLEWISAETLLG